MTRKKPTLVNTKQHAPTLIAAARYYTRAAASYRINRQRETAQHLTRIRYLEAATYFETLLTNLVLRIGPKGRTITTASDAARIKAAAHRVADLLTEAGTTPDLCPGAAYRHLVQLIQKTLQQREAEDATTQTQAHPASSAAPQALAA